ncbi:MAG: DinB family protein [Deltaproteobacteria bacterium]|jgi:hypothetical protein|nr:DinB family protein [Deltaproteobacteria bacterium]
MSSTAVHGLKGIFEMVFNGTEQFIEVCPEHIWEKKFGGWPIWQHVYHALTITGLFALESAETPVSAPMPMEVAMFASTPDAVWKKGDAKIYAANKKTEVGVYLAKLNDANLASKNTGVSQRFDKEMLQSSVSALMIGHLFYHLGVCDSALREEGLQGIL